jgi:hypothetical protein
VVPQIHNFEKYTERIMTVKDFKYH